MSPRTVKNVALLAAVIRLPLLLSFNIKYQWFPAGLPYALLYTGGLVSVVVTPILLLAGLIIFVCILARVDLKLRKSSLAWNLGGVIIAVIAELVFVAARYSAP